MAGQIRITPGDMRDRAGDFRSAGTAYQDVVKRMSDLINILQDEWEGEASRQFALQFESLQPTFQNMDQLITDIAKQCDDTADALEQLDDDIAKKFM